MTLIKQFLKEFATRGSEKTLADYKARLTKFEAWRRSTGATEFDKKNARDYLVHLHGNGTGPASVALHRATLSSFYSWLAENDIIPENPIRSLKYGKYRSPAKGNECTFTDDEYRILKDKLIGHEFWHGAIIVGWNTGLRMGDIANLAWEQITMAERKIVVVPRKTKRFAKVVEIPILPELAEYLIARARESAFVLPQMQIEYAAADAKFLSLHFTRLCEGAGIKDKSFHNLRHSFVTRALSRGVPVPIVASCTGQTLQVINRYLHVRIEDKQKALEVMA